MNPDESLDSRTVNAFQSPKPLSEMSNNEIRKWAEEIYDALVPPAGEDAKNNSEPKND